eukprot:353595-Chlamydomonas_euryale.AAC.1
MMRPCWVRQLPAELHAVATGGGRGSAFGAGVRATPSKRRGYSSTVALVDVPRRRGSWGGSPPFEHASEPSLKGGSTCSADGRDRHRNWGRAGAPAKAPCRDADPDSKGVV